MSSIYGKLKSSFQGHSLSAFNKYKKLLNVSPGPAQLPKQILSATTNDLLGKSNKFQYGNTPLEMSHRSPEFSTILSSLNSNMRKFMRIPDDFEILWTPGGGHGQFAAVPMNLKKIIQNKPVYYAVNGTWSDRAFQESKHFVNSKNIFEEHYKPNENILEYNTMPKIDISKLNEDTYLYLCSNETVNGIEFQEDNIAYPERKDLEKCKLIVDMSSDFLMKSVNWNKIDVAFACSSKNMGVAGANIVIVRKGIINELEKETTSISELPSILNWAVYSQTNSLYNTPAIFNLYIIDKLLHYYSSIGGIHTIHKETINKGKIIYDFLDSSLLFKACVENKEIRSNINIPFIVNNGCLETRNKFLHFCYISNLVGLRTKTPFSYESINLIEPLRINLYNGVSLEETKSVVRILQKFESLYFT